MTNMTNQFSSLEYRRAATHQASVVGLVIALHDTLIGDLQRAAKAMEKNDIPTRCEQLIHGFKVLTQLEAMLDRSNGGEAAVKIGRFYVHVRSQMLSAQFKLKPEILHEQVKIVLEVRQAWEQVDNAPTPAWNSSSTQFGTEPILSQVTERYRSFSCTG